VSLKTRSATVSTTPGVRRIDIDNNRTKKWQQCGSNRHGKWRHLTISGSSSVARFLAYLRALRYVAVKGDKHLWRIVALEKVAGSSPVGPPLICR
jgi:hypothetical protein